MCYLSRCTLNLVACLEISISKMSERLGSLPDLINSVEYPVEYVSILILLTYISINNSCIIVTNNNNKRLLIDSSQNGYSEVSAGAFKSLLAVGCVQCGEKCWFCAGEQREPGGHISQVQLDVKQFGSGTSEAFSWKLLFPTLAFAAIQQKHSNLMCACSYAVAVMQK